MTKRINRKLVLFGPADILILVSAVFLTVWLYSVFWFDNSSYGEADTLLVQFADNTPREYSLNEEQMIKIKGQRGLSLIEIKQGKARFIHSACRNQFCVFHGWLSVAGDTSACLPNRVSISLKGTASDYDALAGAQ